MTKKIILEKDIQEISNTELINLINQFGLKRHGLWKSLKRKYPEIFVQIMSRTHFLDDAFQDRKVEFITRLYCLENNITEVPKCENPECNNYVVWKYPKFAHHCSLRCRSRDPKIQLKRKKTVLLLYGNETPMNVPQFREKSKITSQRKYGCDYPQQAEVVRQRINHTMMTKYGVYHPLQSQRLYEKSIQTNIEHFGVEHPAQSEQVKAKMKMTMNERYGVDWYPQSVEYHKKSAKPYSNPKYPNMTFGSSWEFKVYDFLIEHNIEFEYQPDISISYKYKDKTHTYHPDFRVGNKIVEVKGEQFFRINESGQEEMFCPFRRSDWSDERYEFECGLFNAKYQCMLNNNVIVLREKHMENLEILLA